VRTESNAVWLMSSPYDFHVIVFAFLDEFFKGAEIRRVLAFFKEKWIVTI
jgi:hypothetical protein